MYLPYPLFDDRIGGAVAGAGMADKTILIDSATPIDAPANKIQSGGVVNAHRAVLRALGRDE